MKEIIISMSAGDWVELQKNISQSDNRGQNL